MSLRPCILVPVYNHKKAIAETVAALTHYDLPVILVDDGSDDATQTVLAHLACTQPLVQLLRLPQNCGKGAAVMHGMRYACADGFTHALQIDADGQHDLRDVPKFLERGAASPAAVICGQAVYDASIPKARLYGRLVTHFWVWIETLSFAIADSMCGFRLYPLKATCALIEHERIAQRMDFDIEIVVRLAWRGLAFENIPTRITYPRDGVSHFHMFADNVRISMTHTRLVFGMLRRLPKLLLRRLRGTHPRAHWSRISERGVGWGIRLTASCYRWLGPRAARVLLVPIVGYFFLTGRAARTASLTYLSRLRDYAPREHLPRATWHNSFRHMLNFAQSSLDRLAAWSGQLDAGDIEFPNRDELHALARSGQGAVLIGAHLGNLEMTRAIAANLGIRNINAVVYTEHGRRFAETLSATNTGFERNLLQVSEFGPETAIRLREKIDGGELLVIVGDRTPPAENGRVTIVDFLGRPASFAQGPFILSALLGCPVYLFFCLREESGYHAYFEKFAERVELPRAEREARLRGYIERYARRLEFYCLKAPLQWFNFFDFWRVEPRPQS
jgi:predicted LPLAT superfamily acyltransferase/GT2 family glycosyltransferase